MVLGVGHLDSRKAILHHQPQQQLRILPICFLLAHALGADFGGSQEENHPEGSYFLEWWDRGERHREAVGPHAQDAAEKARIKQAELAAALNGIIPQPQIAEVTPERKTLAAALDAYKDYVRNTTAAFELFGPIVRFWSPSRTNLSSVTQPLSTASAETIGSVRGVVLNEMVWFRESPSCHDRLDRIQHHN